MAESKNVWKREEVKEEDRWAIEDLYPCREAWEKDAEILRHKIDKLEQYQGTLGESSRVLSGMLEEYSSTSQLFERLYVYANQRLHENTADSTSQKLTGEAQVLMTLLNSKTAYIVPEILNIPQEKLNIFIEEDEGLKPFRIFLTQIIRQKEHTLTKEMEELMAKIDELAQGPGNIFSIFNNADITFPPITNEEGNEVPLTHGRYAGYLESSSRQVRRDAFMSLYHTYRQFENTLAATFDSNVRHAVFEARERKYGSSLEAALDGSKIPTEVYDNLIQTVHGHMDLMYRYLKLRKRALGVEELHMYDVYVSLVDDVDMKIPFDKAKEIVLDGLAPLGEEYAGRLREGFENRWIDVYENQGKRTGAYSWGAYGVHPYVLLNYQENLNQVFTLAHEMGHALHSSYSDEKQPYLYAGYKIFVAEVASTCNEALLIHHLLEQTSDKKEKAYLINYFLNQFKGTLYRQTMFAEFEKKAHKEVENGGTLNAAWLNETYYNLNREYFGDGVVLDEEIALEWARIPHFYTPFYVYQYATGFSAAIAISSKILKKEPGIVEKYKEFLSGGSSMDCIDLLKLCGVDMTKPEPVKDALKVFREYLEELEQLL